MTAPAPRRPRAIIDPRSAPRGAFPLHSEGPDAPRVVTRAAALALALAALAAARRRRLADLEGEHDG